MSGVPIQFPGRFAPGVAVSFSDSSGESLTVSQSSPLPVVAAMATAPAPLSGSTTQAVIAGPFIPVRLRPVTLQLSGSWSGSVQVLRSVDNGVTKTPLTAAGSPWGVFSGNCCEPVWEEGEDLAAVYLDIAPTSGTVVYRLGQ